MDLNSVIEMSALQHNQENSKPTQIYPSTPFSTVPLPIRIDTSTSTIDHSTTLPPASTPDYEPNSLANPFTLPFQTLVVRSHTLKQRVKLFVRTSTLYRIPYLSQKLPSGELRSDEDFYMLDESNDADSLGLLFGFVQTGTVPSLIRSDIDVEVAGKDERALRYVRAYPLAGRLGLECIQNHMVDHLVAHYLECPVLASDIGILIQAGAANSKLGTLLMRELARNILDGSHHESLQHKDNSSEKTSTDRPSNMDQNNSDDDAGTTDMGIPNTVLEQIQQYWTLQESTSLIAMMIKAHNDAKDPINRSPMELAAADQCTIHTHSTTNVCPRHGLTTGQKRKRTLGEEDDSDEDESENGESDAESDKDNDSDSANLSSSQTIEVQNETTKPNKENVGPDSSAHGGSGKETRESLKPSAPSKKRPKLRWLFG